MYITTEEPNRLKRLLKVKKFLIERDIHPKSINDHEGCLEVTWDKIPGITEKNLCHYIWEKLNEIHIRHFYPVIKEEEVVL